jgi:hypothetical protein
VTEQASRDARVPGDEQWRERGSKKELKRLQEFTGRLAPWERYRALNDAMDEYYEMLDLANREARFALIIVGALNAALFVIGTRSSLLTSMPPGARPWVGLGLIAYGAVAVHFFLQAIEVLRPRKFHPRLKDSALPPELLPVGVRYYEDVLQREADGHCKAWEEVRLSQLNSELAVQGHSLSLKVRAKHNALRNLFGGLRVMTLLAAGMLMVMVLFSELR